MTNQTDRVGKPQSAQNYDLEAEACLLGACLLDPKAINDIPGLEIKHLSGNHAAIFKAIQAVKAKGREIDIITVGSELKAAKQFKTIGGNDYLSRLINTVPTAAHIKSYADNVLEKARRRGLAKLGKDFEQLAGKTKDGDKDLTADDVVGQALIKAEQLALDTATIAGIDTPHDTAAYTAYLRERPPLASWA